MQATLAFLALLLPLTLSPGPATIALAGQGMRSGMAGSLPFLSVLSYSGTMAEKTELSPGALLVLRHVEWQHDVHDQPSIPMDEFVRLSPAAGDNDAQLRDLRDNLMAVEELIRHRMVTLGAQTEEDPDGGAPKAWE